MKRYLETLKHVFGYSAFNSGQERILQHIIQKEDTLALMETGGGKSLCYQLPVISEGGRALVITPLIALMEDQVASLKRVHIKAAAIHSHLDIRDKQFIARNISQFQFIYCSPEWLSSRQAREFIKDIDFTHIIIDEAHCISEWGFDFRPHYLLLAQITNDYKDAQVIALTATANDRIVSDIIKVLNRKMEIVDVRSPRNNIYLSVLHVTENEKFNSLLKYLSVSGPTIIYFSSKRKCDEISESLALNGIESMTYHADKDYEERMRVQSLFMADMIQVVCATSAFGMGINKSNIRTVIHFHMPKSIFQYQQEIGRAGRDGNVSQAIALYDEQDLNLANRLILEGNLDVETFELYRMGITLPEQTVEHIEILTQLFDDQSIIRHLSSEKNEKLKQLDAIHRYVTSEQCLGQELYGFNQPCGNCSICKGDKNLAFENVHENQKTNT